MYSAKYITKIKINSEGKRKERSSLVAKFRFNKEVAPKYRKEVRERIKEVKRRCLCSYDTYGIGFLGLGLGFELFSRKLSPNKSSLNTVNDYILTGDKSISLDSLDY